MSTAIHPTVVPVMYPVRAAYANRLLDQARRALRARIGDPRTERIYGLWIERFLEFAAPARPEDLDTLAAAAYLTRLALAENVSPIALRRARRALAFLEIVVLRRVAPLPELGGPAS
jgi:hypothetical protein